MPDRSFALVWIQSNLIALGLVLGFALLTTALDPVRSSYLLHGTLAVFLRWIPASFIAGFILTFNLRLDVAWLQSGVGPFLSRLLLLAGISAVAVSMTVFLFEPTVNADLDQAIRSQALTERIARQIARYEEDLAEGVIRQEISTETILATYRRDINRRIGILMQLENLYTILASVAPETDRIVARMDSIRAQLEEQRKNLRRLPRIQLERQLLWSDFTNLTSDSSLLLAQELHTKSQWPESYQIASLAVLLGETTGAAERLRKGAREELFKLPMVDGEFFQRKSRLIALYQAGLFREAYFGLAQMKNEGWVDDEIVNYLELSREQVQTHFTFIEEARLSLEVPIAAPVFWTQNSVIIPGAREWFSAEWLSLSRMGYLLKSPRVLRQGPGGEWQGWKASYARVRADPSRPTRMMLDFNFLHERVNQAQEKSPGMYFSTLPLELDRFASSMLVDSRLRPESVSFFHLFPLVELADGLGSNSSAFLAEIFMRIWSIPFFMTGVFLIISIGLYLHTREGLSTASLSVATAVTAAGLFIGFDVFHWAARVLLGGLAHGWGMTATALGSGLVVATLLAVSLILLVRTSAFYSSGTR